ncbi:MAG: hypothetical protein J6I49_01985 [Bacteroidales bacterium]|nr:hypothetical protein [Bacteroidales bacterium]
MKLLSHDTVPAALAAGVGSMLATAALLTAGLMTASLPPLEHLRWYAACFIPPILIMRRYMSNKQATAAKTIIVLLFLTLIPFLAYLLRTNTLQPQ